MSETVIIFVLFSHLLDTHLYLIPRFRLGGAIGYIQLFCVTASFTQWQIYISAYY